MRPCPRPAVRDDFFPDAPTIESCLTDLAVHAHVTAPPAPSHACLVFRDTRVLNHAMEGRIMACAPARRSTSRAHDREAVAAVISLRDGTAHWWPHVSTERLAHHGSRPAQGRGADTHRRLN